MDFRNKQEYIRSHNIAAFLDFLVNCCKPDGFNHQWLSYSRRFTGVAKGKSWTCNSLIDAFEKYYWPAEDPISNSKIESFDETSAVLDELSKRLLDAISLGDKLAAQHICRLILRWGAVESKPHVAAKFKDPEFDIVSHLSKMKSFLGHIMSGGDLEAHELPTFQRMDSGVTKVYALIAPGFAIFDSRVGCALGLLVREFWLKNHAALEDLPMELRFLWGGNIESRNPNLAGQRIFPAFRAVSDQIRFDQNIQISWLLQELGERLLKSGLVKDMTSTKIVRVLETSLFMIGYGTSNTRKSSTRKKNEVGRPRLPSEFDGNELGLLRNEIQIFKQLNPKCSGTAVLRIFYFKLADFPREPRNRLIIETLNLTPHATNTIWYSLRKEYQKSTLEDVVS